MGVLGRGLKLEKFLIEEQLWEFGSEVKSLVSEIRNEGGRSRMEGGGRR